MIKRSACTCQCHNPESSIIHMAPCCTIEDNDDLLLLATDLSNRQDIFAELIAKELEQTQCDQLCEEAKPT